MADRAEVTHPFARAAQAQKDRLGWSIRALAAKSGVPVMTVHRAVTTGNVTLSAALRIAIALGMDTGDFIERRLLTAAGAGPLLDPDCRDGKHGSCVGAPCECGCHGGDDG